MRQAFLNLWELNVKAIPTALIWAGSLWLLLQSPLFVGKVAAATAAHIAAVISAVLIVKLQAPSAQIRVLDILKDRFLLKISLLIDLLLVMSLQNLDRFSGSSMALRLIYVATTLSLLILWGGLIVFLIPLCAQTFIEKREFDLTQVLKSLVSIQKRYLTVVFLILFLTWPLIFFYIFLALTLGQSIVISALSAQIDQSSYVLKTGVPHD